MATIAQLQKEARKAPQFILMGFKDGYTFYIADRNLCKDDGTVNINKAQKFSVGFDDEQRKAKAWSICFGVEMSVVKLVHNG